MLTCTVFFQIGQEILDPFQRNIDPRTLENGWQPPRTALIPDHHILQTGQQPEPLQPSNQLFYPDGRMTV